MRILSHSRRRRDFRRRRRQARSGASREVCAPTALAGRGALSGGCQPSGPSRFDVIATGQCELARSVVRQRPPVRFCARGERGSERWCGGRFPGFWLVCVAWAPFDGNPSRHELPNTLPSAAAGAGATRLVTRSSVARPHQSEPARACLVRGGSFVAAVSRTRRSGPAASNLRDLAGRSGFFPRSARRRSWGCALRRVAPELGWTTRGNPRG